MMIYKNKWLTRIYKQYLNTIMITDTFTSVHMTLTLYKFFKHVVIPDAYQMQYKTKKRTIKHQVNTFLQILCSICRFK